MHDHTFEVAREVSRRDVLRGLGGGAGLALAGCTQTGSGDSGRATLVYAQPMSFVDFDPVVLNDVPSAEVAGLVFESLYEYDADLEPVPKLASEQPTIERGGERWIVPLATDATFQHGDPVTATDVAYSYRAPLTEGTDNVGEVNMIADATALDETTVQFDLQFEFGAFRYYLGRPIVPKSVREADKTAFNTSNPVGSGPFEFVRGTEGAEAVVRRWEDYWDEPVPNVEEVVFTPISEGTTRVTTLKTGESDVIREIPAADWETVRSMDDAHVEDVLGINYVFLGFNCKEGPATDRQVREAVDYAVSMDRAVSRFVEPSGERVHSPIPRELAEKWDFPVERWRSIGHDQDVDRAKALLDDAEAVPADWSPTIIVPPDEMRENVAISVANGLSAAGYDASVDRLDWPTFTERYRSGSADSFDAFALGWSGVPDPDTFLYFLFAHEMIGATNGTHYRNDDLNRALVEARRSTDPGERAALYERAVEIVLEARVHLPAYTLRNSFGVGDHVADWRAHPVTYFDLVSPTHNVTIQ